MTASAFFGYNLAKNYIGQLKWVFEVLSKTYKLEKNRPNFPVEESGARQKKKKQSYSCFKVDLFFKHGKNDRMRNVRRIIRITNFVSIWATQMYHATEYKCKIAFICFASYSA